MRMMRSTELRRPAVLLGQGGSYRLFGRCSAWQLRVVVLELWVPQ